MGTEDVKVMAMNMYKYNVCKFNVILPCTFDNSCFITIIIKESKVLAFILKQNVF